MFLVLVLELGAEKAFVTLPASECRKILNPEQQQIASFTLNGYAPLSVDIQSYYLTQQANPTPQTRGAIEEVIATYVEALPHNFTHFLSHIPKTGAEYAAQDLARHGDPTPEHICVDRGSSCHEGTGQAHYPVPKQDFEIGFHLRLVLHIN